MRKRIRQAQAVLKKLKPKHKLTIKGWIALVLCLGVLSVALFLYFTRPTPIDRLSLTYLDNLSADTLAVDLQESFEDTYSIRDYTIYGESLVLYQSDYENEGYDDLYGKNVALRNLQTGQELNFTFSGGADGGIDLGLLEPGVYEVFVYDQYTKKRVYSTQEFESIPFTTMRRNKEVNEVLLDASDSYLSKFGIQLDKNYLFLTVTDSLPKVKIVDVFIDPSGLTSYSGMPGYDEGYISEIINEPEASYILAMAVQDHLQEAGLRVELTRSDKDDNGYFGVGSRVGLGYQKQAKVFLSLAMTVTETNRPFVLCSPFTNAGLANQIAYELTQNGIELSTVSTLSRVNNGVALDELITNDEYQYTNWSYYPQLRETGGKVTFTGTGSSWLANANFSENYGMYGILFSYASTIEEDSQVYYLSNQEAIARSLAQGILNYFHIVTEVPAP